MTVYVQIGHTSGGKACCDWLSLSCAVMWPRSAPADLVDNGHQGEISYEPLCRPFTIGFIVIYSHLAGAWISVGPVSTDSVLY